eukprot:scaffold1803_cov195-Alexandrium_tamarense.AAC.14
MHTGLLSHLNATNDSCVLEQITAVGYTSSESNISDIIRNVPFPKVSKHRQRLCQSIATGRHYAAGHECYLEEEGMYDMVQMDMHCAPYTAVVSQSSMPLYSC